MAKEVDERLILMSRISVFAEYWNKRSSKRVPYKFINALIEYLLKPYPLEGVTFVVRDANGEEYERTVL